MEQEGQPNMLQVRSTYCVSLSVSQRNQQETWYVTV